MQGLCTNYSDLFCKSLEHVDVDIVVVVVVVFNIVVVSDVMSEFIGCSFHIQQPTAANLYRESYT